MPTTRFDFYDLAPPGQPRPRRSKRIAEDQVEIWEIRCLTLRHNPWWCLHVGYITGKRIIRAGSDLWLLDSKVFTYDGCHYLPRGDALIRITEDDAVRVFELEGLPLPTRLSPIPLALDPTTKPAASDLPSGSDRPDRIGPTPGPPERDPDPTDGTAPPLTGTTGRPTEGTEAAAGFTPPTFRRIPKAETVRRLMEGIEVAERRKDWGLSKDDLIARVDVKRSSAWWCFGKDSGLKNRWIDYLRKSQYTR